MAYRDISLRCGIWSLSGHGGLWQAERPADLWVHGLNYLKIRTCSEENANNLQST